MKIELIRIGIDEYEVKKDGEAVKFFNKSLIENQNDFTKRVYDSFNAYLDRVREEREINLPKVVEEVII